MKTNTCLHTLCLSLLAALPISLWANNAYLLRNLVSDIPNLADYTDASLKGAWGISESGGSPFWIADAATGLSTLYSSSGSVIPLKVTIPGGTTAQGTPTGTVFNFNSPAFAVAAGKPAFFLFDTLDGTISGWNPQVDGTHAIVKVNNSSAGAGYTGLAIATSNSKPY